MTQLKTTPLCGNHAIGVDDVPWDDDVVPASSDDDATRVQEPLQQTLRREGPSHWLWCLYCHRFFQAHSVRTDYLGNREGCAFCGAAGFNVALFSWDAFRNPLEPWPASAAELSHGMRLKIWTLRRYIALDDDETSCQVFIDPKDRWVYAITFDPDSGRDIDDGGQCWGTIDRPIVVPLGYSECHAAKRGKWAIVETKGRRLAADPLRYHRRWLREEAPVSAAGEDSDR